MPEGGAFAPPELPGFRATMALSDSPPSPPSFPRTAELRAPPAGVSLPALRSPLADMPCPLPRRTEPVRGSVASHSWRPSPYLRRCPRFHFRGLLRLTARYGLPACSPGFPRTLSRGFRPADYPTAPLVSFHAYRQLHEWAPSSHRVSAPKRRTEKCRLASKHEIRRWRCRPGPCVWG